ncbi:MAG: sigma 54-interacting transcriptional regulator [Deltaproteobacteria bacterium]|nr:sigma 54-interacting transcriptional regulator [Deltaproteobacteria bacterium]
MVRPLGRGSSGRVLLVEDLHHESRLLALKAIGPGADSALLRWEFSELAGLSHPNLARVFEIDRVTAAGGDLTTGLARGTAFFTAEFVPGRNADEAADALGDDLDRRGRFAVELGIGVARALAFVHGKGILHRDVKPANLVVPSDEPAAVRLVDFGLSRRRSVQDGLVAGSLPYLAPEALGARGDVRSDLYALGVVLYRVASGRLPFAVPEGGDLRPVLGAILAADAPSLEELCPGIDRGLARVVGRLLLADPGARHASARSVAADLARASRLGRSAREVTGVVDSESETDTPEARVGWVRSVGLVARRKELDDLLCRIRASLEGAGPIVARVAGGFGSGRTRLVREAWRRLQLEAATEGRPAAHETSGSVAVLASALSCPADPLAVGERLLAPANPGSPASEARWGGNPGSPASEARWGGIAGPRVVHLDPGDSPEARALVAHLERATPDPGVALSVVAEVDAGTAGAIELAPFGLREIEAFLEAIIAGPAPKKLAQSLLDATGGLPLLVEEALLAMVRDRPISELARTTVPKLALPRSLELAMDARVAALGADLADTLAALAVLEANGGSAASEVLEIDSAECARRIASLSRLGLCEIPLEDLAVVRLPVAAAALRRAGAEREARLHRAALGVVQDPERRALHALGAGLGAEAAELALEAAEAAAARGDLPAAIRHMRAAQGRLPEARRGAAAVTLAALQARAGEYAAARETLAGAPQDDDTVGLLDAEVARRMGDAPAAQRRLARLLAPGGERSVALEARSLAARLALDAGDLERAMELLGSDDPAGAPDARAAHAEVVGLVRLRAGDHREAGQAFARAGELARTARDARLEARALSLEGTALHMCGEAAGAAGRYQEAARIAREAGDVHGEATYTVNLGSALVDGGRYGEALPAYRRAIEILARLGATRQIAGALANYANLLFFLGDAEAATEANLRAMRSADAAGDAIVRGYVTMNLGDIHRRKGEVRASADRYREAAAIFESVSSPRDAAFARLSGAELALAEDDLEAARAERDRAVAAAGSGATGELAIRLDLLDARIGLETNELDGAAEAAERASERAGRLGHRDLVLRAAGVVARVAQSRGDVAGLRQAGRIAAEATRLLLASVPDVYRQSFLDDPERRVASELAAAELTARPPHVSREAGDATARDDAVWRRLSAVTKRLASELRLPILLEYILDTAIELLEADRGFLLIRGKDGALAIRSARNFSRAGLQGDELQLSRSIAQSVALGADPVVAVDALTDGRFESTASVQSFKLRSVLAVPLRVHGGILGALYLDDRYRPGVFGPADVELAHELADQAAIAIENARLHAENRRRARRIEALNRRLERTVESQRSALDQMRGALDRSLEALETKYRYEDLVGRSGAMSDVLRLIDRVTDADVSVVIHGESGTGKELVARAIHYNGPRRARPFIPVNCGAFTETLLESELFGHVRGAFTGADRTRTGLFEAANEGTLLLDEVAEMSVAMQAKLLRVLQESEVRPVGGNETRKVDVRVIAASNRDLGALVQTGKFREDLYYRLNVITLELPALRDRKEDIPELVAHFVEKHGSGRAVSVEKKAMARLYAYPWPGNVRQLENEVMRFLVLADDAVLEEHLSPEIAAGSPDEETAADDLDLKSQVERLERRLIRRALRESRGNQTKTARALGLSRFGLQKKLRRYGLG